MEETKLISIIIPVYNEEAILDTLYQKINEVTSSLRHSFEIIFINDGSEDTSLQKLLGIASEDKRVKVIDLSRNFGHQIAISAGIDHSDGDAVVLMDADMEDNPAYIKDFVDKWEAGYDVVYAIRGKREVTPFRNLFFGLFHKLNNYLIDIHVPASGIFGLMSKDVVIHLKELKEHNRYIPGLRTWLGFKQVGLEIDRDKRYDSHTRVSTLKLVKLALDSYVSFSKLPLTFASIMGIIFSIGSFLAIIAVFILKLTVGFNPEGWASTVIIILFIGGIQLISIGIIGEYIGRIMDEVKARPLYIVKETHGFDKKQ